MGWQELWQNPEIAARWAEMPPAPEVVEMADRLEREGVRRVLDIGCGMGRHLVYLAARGFAVVGTDNAPEAITACRRSLDEMALLRFRQSSCRGRARDAPWTASGPFRNPQSAIRIPKSQQRPTCASST